MAPNPAAAAADVDGADESPAPAKGELKRYPVTQPTGNVKHQVVLILTDPDPETGKVRGWPLGYEDLAAEFHPSQFA